MNIRNVSGGGCAPAFRFLGFLLGWKDRSVNASDVKREPEDGVNHLQKVVSMRHWTVSKDSLNYACLLEVDIDYT